MLDPFRGSISGGLEKVVTSLLTDRLLRLKAIESKANRVVDFSSAGEFGLLGGWGKKIFQRERVCEIEIEIEKDRL